MRFPSVIDGITWSRLAGWQRSFGSKAAIALPVISFAVAALPFDWFRNHLIANWRIQAVFWGAVVFLVGQVVLWKRRPIEFARDTDVHQDIAEAKEIDDYSTFESKRDLLSKTVTRMEGAGVIDSGRLALAKARLEEANAAGESDWKPHLAKVILAQRSLREFDDRGGRRITVVLLGLGTVLIAAPMVQNVAVTVWVLIKSYLG